MSCIKNELELATEVVRKATEITEWFRIKGFKSFQKADESPVTLADIASQIYIISKLKELYPKDQIIAEETFEIDSKSHQALKKCFLELQLENLGDLKHIINYRGSSSERQWTIDPIDGTKGYQKGLSYAIGLGLMIKSKPELSVISVPNYDERGLAIFIAEKDQGAKASYGNGLFESINASTKRELQDAVMCHSLHYDKQWVLKFANEMEISNRIPMDSMAKFCKVADGSADIYIKPLDPNRSFSWDFLPGELLVREAGGEISDLNGALLKFNEEKTIFTGPGLFASNGMFHNDVVNKFKLFQQKLILK